MKIHHRQRTPTGILASLPSLDTTSGSITAHERTHRPQRLTDRPPCECEDTPPPSCLRMRASRQHWYRFYWHWHLAKIRILCPGSSGQAQGWHGMGCPLSRKTDSLPWIPDRGRAWQEGASLPAKKPTARNASPTVILAQARIQATLIPLL